MTDKGQATAVAPSGDDRLDNRIWPTKWATTDLTFWFADDAADYGAGYFGTLPAPQRSVFSPVPTGPWRDVVFDAFDAIEAFTGLTFIRVTSGVDTHLRFGGVDGPGEDYDASGQFPDGSAYAGDLWFGVNELTAHFSNYLAGGGKFSIMLHEIGHTLGLTHGEEETGSVGGGPLGPETNSLEYSVVSYRAYVGAEEFGHPATGSSPQSYMIYDIAALQYLYGADFSTNSGNTVYSFSPSTGQLFIDGAGQGVPADNKVFRTVWDGGGADTYDFSNYSSNLIVRLAPGAWTVLAPGQIADLGEGHSAVGCLANALQFEGNGRSLIENAIGGSGADIIVGNLARNLIRGNDGRDTISGGEGADSLNGGEGNDRLVGGLGNDELRGGLGNDTVAGGLGRDELNGGTGSDDFDFNSLAETGVTKATRDKIAGFVHRADDIDLSTIDAIPGGADNAFAFRGINAFTAAGQVRLQQSGADTIVEINTAGTGGAEATILLAGITATTITGADFVL